MYYILVLENCEILNCNIFSFFEHYDHYHHLLCQTDHRQTLFLHTLLMANQSIKI